MATTTISEELASSATAGEEAAWEGAPWGRGLHERTHVGTYTRGHRHMRVHTWTYARGHVHVE